MTAKQCSFIGKFYGAVLALCCSFAAAAAEPIVVSTDRIEDTAPSVAVLKRNYVHLMFSKSYPVYNSQHLFRANDEPDASLYYRYLSRDSMLLGLGAGVKTLFHSDSGKVLRLYHMTQELYYSLRLYHPLYLDLGANLHYLTPYEVHYGKQRKAYNYSAEFGCGVRAQLSIKADWGLFSAYVSRLRGVATDRLHFFEAGLGYSYLLE